MMKLKLSKKNLFLFILFAVTTAFFMFQHALYLEWDFSAYVLNAKYLFSNGFYFEWSRAPLMPLLLSVFSFITFGNYVAAEYLYIFFVSLLFFIASITLAKKLKIDYLIFYALLLSPFLLLLSFAAGTELLSLSLIMLALNFTLSDKKNSAILLGIFVGLAFLTHYTAIIFVFLFFVRKPWLKRTFTSLLFFFIIVLPWFFYNFLATGSFLTSIADSYAQNILFRDYLFTPFNLTHFLQLYSYYYLAFFFIGIFVFLKKLKKREIDFLPALLMLIIFILVLYSYVKIPLKSSRYLFRLVLPVTFFSTLFFEKLKEKLSKKTIFIILITIILVNFFSSFFIFLSYIYVDSNRLEYKNFFANIEKDCMYFSDKWVYLNYFGIVAEPMPWSKEEFFKNLEKGKRSIVFNLSEIDYFKDNSFVESLPLIDKTSNYMIIGNKSLCAKPYKVNRTYLEIIREKNITTLSNCQIVMPEFLEFLCKK